MAKIISTIWALLLNTVGVSVFQTCFTNAMEDDEGESILSGPPVTSFLFASGAYVIIVKFDLFPQSLKKPNQIILLFYEVLLGRFLFAMIIASICNASTILMSIVQFLVTAFLLEFAVACIWAPIDVLILTTIPNIISEFCLVGQIKSEDSQPINKTLAMLSYALASAFFFLALHVTRAIDFDIFTECGPGEFIEHMKTRLISRIQSELPSRRIRCGRKGCRCKSNCTRCTSKNRRKS